MLEKVAQEYLTIIEDIKEHLTELKQEYQAEKSFELKFKIKARIVEHERILRELQWTYIYTREYFNKNSTLKQML